MAQKKNAPTSKASESAADKRNFTHHFTTRQALRRLLLAAAAAPHALLMAVFVVVVALLSFSAQAATTDTSAAKADTLAPKPKGPVPEKHLWFSGSNPHRQAGFAHAQILGSSAPALPQHGFGRGGPTRKDGRMAEPMFFTPRPPYALKTQTVDSQIRSGIQTMTTTTQGRIAPALATSATHHHTTEERRAFAALEAANCAALARWYSARGNVKAARRKAVQLLAALAVLEGVQHV